MSSTFDSKLNENIGHAFKVVGQTYESMYKLFAALDEKAKKEKYLSRVTTSPNFLRWRSDQEYSGWFIGSAIKLYQHQIDLELEGGWRKGPVYLIEVQLIYDKEQKLFGPEIITAQFTYENIEESFPKPPGMGDHGKFYYPLREVADNPGDEIPHTRQFSFKEPEKKFGGLKEILFRRRPLAFIDQSNFGDLIKDFEEFRGMENS